MLGLVLSPSCVLLCPRFETGSAPFRRGRDCLWGDSAVYAKTRFRPARVCGAHDRSQTEAGPELARVRMDGGRILAAVGQMAACPFDGKSVLVKELADFKDQLHILAAVKPVP